MKLSGEFPIWNQILFYQALRTHASGRKWLDLGCGRGTTDPALIPIRQSMKEQFYVGTDLDRDSLKDCPEPNKILANAASLPFQEGSFDLISSNMVFEHLVDPLSVLREARRVLSNGGHLIIHTPSSSHFMLILGRILSSFLPASLYRKLVSLYEGRKEEDVFLTYYRANDEKLLADLARKAGLRLLSIRYLETPFVTPQFLHGFERSFRKRLSGRFKSSMLVLMIRIG